MKFGLLWLTNFAIDVQHHCSIPFSHLSCACTHVKSSAGSFGRLVQVSRHANVHACSHVTGSQMRVVGKVANGWSELAERGVEVEPFEVPTSVVFQ